VGVVLVVSEVAVGVVEHEAPRLPILVPGAEHEHDGALEVPRRVAPLLAPLDGCPLVLIERVHQLDHASLRESMKQLTCHAWMLPGRTSGSSLDSTRLSQVSSPHTALGGLRRTRITRPSMSHTWPGSITAPSGGPRAGSSLATSRRSPL